MRTPCSFLCLLVPNKAPEVSQDFILHLFHVVIIKIKSIQLQFYLNSSKPQLQELFHLCYPWRTSQTASLDAPETSVYVSLIVVLLCFV